jgi:hypothetical protein
VTASWVAEAPVTPSKVSFFFFATAKVSIAQLGGQLLYALAIKDEGFGGFFQSAEVKGVQNLMVCGNGSPFDKGVAAVSIIKLFPVTHNIDTPAKA